MTRSSKILRRARRHEEIFSVKRRRQKRR